MHAYQILLNHHFFTKTKLADRKKVNGVLGRVACAKHKPGINPLSQGFVVAVPSTFFPTPTLDLASQNVQNQPLSVERGRERDCISWGTRAQ